MAGRVAQWPVGVAECFLVGQHYLEELGVGVPLCPTLARFARSCGHDRGIEKRAGRGGGGNEGPQECQGGDWYQCQVQLSSRVAVILPKQPRVASP